MKITEAKLRQIIREELAQDEQLNEFVGGLSAKSRAKDALERLAYEQGTEQDRAAVKSFLVKAGADDATADAYLKELEAETVAARKDGIYLRGVDFIDGARATLEKGR